MLDVPHHRVEQPAVVQREGDTEERVQPHRRREHECPGYRYRVRQPGHQRPVEPQRPAENGWALDEHGGGGGSTARSSEETDHRGSREACAANRTRPVNNSSLADARPGFQFRDFGGSAAWGSPRPILSEGLYPRRRTAVDASTIETTANPAITSSDRSRWVPGRSVSVARTASAA